MEIKEIQKIVFKMCDKPCKETRTVRKRTFCYSTGRMTFFILFWIVIFIVCGVYCPVLYILLIPVAYLTFLMCDDNELSTVKNYDVIYYYTDECPSGDKEDVIVE